MKLFNFAGNSEVNQGDMEASPEITEDQKNAIGVELKKIQDILNPQLNP